ncbi:MAG: hypothetical protein BWY20_02184 [Spirochaetes bacterium ADurb.Bin215]|nr:MAG: hypothetical protein BWY20_02184 [Spirochaetes bacterium ADurb.Bin215]
MPFVFAVFAARFMEAMVRRFSVPIFKRSAWAMDVISATSARSSAMTGEAPTARSAFAQSFTVT